MQPTAHYEKFKSGNTNEVQFSNCGFKNEINLLRNKSVFSGEHSTQKTRNLI